MKTIALFSFFVVLCFGCQNERTKSYILSEYGSPYYSNRINNIRDKVTKISSTEKSVSDPLKETILKKEQELTDFQINLSKQIVSPDFSDEDTKEARDMRNTVYSQIKTLKEKIEELETLLLQYEIASNLQQSTRAK